MTTNSDVEAKLAQAIRDYLRELGLLPNGYLCEVHLHRGDRKKRRDAEFQGNWSPSKDSIRIAFSPAGKEQQESPNAQAATSPTMTNPMPLEGPLPDLLRALDRAERRPGYEFVSLKWFRDTALPREGFSWAGDESTRHDILRMGIDRRLILTSKIANPRSPHFPVTAIRLNRQMSAVNSALGGPTVSPSAFHPITIRGESLSATVLHDRR
ncbi:MAG: hypothetical protein JOY67_16705 [Hyphomicrobiales bacterium]|nr:hypothetical protein [Hyphomicrobiales bacterium]MBV9520170.1 hypothetical protein [Hyphomicrobiales bacterium]